MKLIRLIHAFLIALMMVTVVGCASTTGESTGQYIDDAAITAKTKAAIFNEPDLKAAEINVETFKGVVQLSGFVSSQEAINHAVEVARKVEGVVSVRNDMQVKMDVPSTR